MIKILKEYKSIICLDGDLPCDLLRKLDLPIVAADGAANTLIKNGIEPAVIIGDLDSVDQNLLRNRVHLKIADQDTTDFEKALNFVEEKSMAPAVVMGIDGGYLDHILGNISIFSRTKFIAATNDIIFMTIEDDKILDVPQNTKISIFGAPRCVATSRGLKWELDNYEMSLDGKNSRSNRAAFSRVELKVSSGKALVFIYAKDILDMGSF